MMKDRWKNNLGLKVMAVLFSIFLWWTVVNIDDPVTTGKFETEIVILNSEEITSMGKSYRIVDDMKEVVVTVKARRKVLEEIEAEDIKVTADLRERQDNTLVPIRIEIEGFEGDYEDASANPRNIQIAIEDTLKKTFPITPVVIGEVSEGFEIGNMRALPQSIDISGPQSSLGRITKVVAKVDVSGLAEDDTLQAEEVIYYDQADNIIDKSMLTSNRDQDGVKIEIELFQMKKVELKFDTSEINTGAGYVFSGLEIEPQAIMIAGKADQLENLQYLEIGSAALKQDGITSNVEVVVDIEQYLPEGIKLAGEGEDHNVVVRIILEKSGTKSILLPVRSIKVNGAASGLELSYGPAQEIELQFSGANYALQELSVEKIIAMIDLTQYTTAGTYDVPVKVTDLPEQCVYLGGATVQIILQER